MGYSVERNSIGTLPNAPLASAPGKELHPPILSTLAIQARLREIERHDIIIYYFLKATQTLTFRYIKWTPDFAFTSSFLFIALGQYGRRGMGKKLPLKMWNKSVVASFHSEILPMVSCPFRGKLEAGV